VTDINGKREHEQRSTMRTLTAEEFVRRLRAYTVGGAAETQYALFIGAGCSASSGIPSAGALVRDHWIPRLRDVRAPEENDASEWVKREFGIDQNRLPPGAYGQIMTELLPYPALRQAEMEALCGAGRPGFGYATLAQLMAESGSRFNIVLTTNFDDLVADALYLFAGVHPLVIHHGALSPYIRATRTRPLVVKLHGHHQFSPLNTHEETQQVEPGLAAGVRSLLHDRGLIFIGYSGSDDGIREVLEALPPEALPYGVFWVSGNEPEGPIRPWLDERKAIWIRHQDFDELMVHVRGVFGLQMPDVKRVQEAFDAVQQDYLSLSEKIRTREGARPEEAALRDAAARVDRTVRDWAVYELRAQRFKSSDPDRAKAVYREGLADLPNSVPLHGNFANYLNGLGEFNEAEEHYQRALELDPKFPIVLHDYAIFLWRYRGDEDKARHYIDQAIAFDPGDDATRLSNYANFAWEVRKDIDGAEQLFRRAVNVPSTTHQPFVQYGLFTQIERLNYQLAEDLYQEAMRRKPDDVSTLINFSNLAAIRGDVETAAQLLERAYAVDDENLHVLGAFANFLWHQRIDFDRAQALFEKARSKTPRYSHEVYYYAMLLAQYGRFLAQERRAVEDGWNVQLEASELLPDNVDLIATRAAYLGIEMKKPEAALTLIDETISTKGETDSLIGAKADVILQAYGDRETAERLYRRALQLEPAAPFFEANLAGILFASGNPEEAMPLCRDAIRRVGRAYPNLAVECFFYVFAHGPDDTRQETLRILKWLMTGKARSPGWNFSPNVERATADGHPNAEWLPQLAAVISSAEDISVLSSWPEWEQSAPLTQVETDRLEKPLWLDLLES
jgi:tetratricopeptide (TPR) repeat protein